MPEFGSKKALTLFGDLFLIVKLFLSYDNDDGDGYDDDGAGADGDDGVVNIFLCLLVLDAVSLSLQLLKDKIVISGFHIPAIAYEAKIGIYTYP